MDVPETRYAKSGDVSIAYAVAGDGPFDLVFVVGAFLSTLDVAWEGPAREFFEQLASFCRLIIFDKRGTGLSDRGVGIPNLETRMDDVRAVMDAAGSQRAAIMGVSEGGPMTMLFAATYPERTAATVLFGTGPSQTANAEVSWRPAREEYLRYAEERERRWGDQAFIDELLGGFAPSLAGDDAAREWWRRLCRLSASPRAAGDLMRMNASIDVRHVLPTIRVPTLVLHRADDEVFELRDGRFIAERVPGAEFVELEGADHAWFAFPGQIVDAVRPFVEGLWQRGEWEEVEPDRVLATVLFTDIVGSSERAVALGDRAWREVLERHHDLVRRQLVRFRGTEVDTAGDGFFASFDGPARAIRCACAIVESTPELGLDVRAGLHTGECELVNGKVAGIAVHTGARVAANAKPGEVLVSSTVRDLVAGSELAFQDRGRHELKGIPGEWRLYAVDRVMT